MSYILDALKKSERERALVRGVGFGDASQRLTRDKHWVPWLVAAIVLSIVIVAVTAVSLRYIATVRVAGPVSTQPADTAEQQTTPVEGNAIAAQAVSLLPAVGEANLLSAMSSEFQRSLPEMTMNIHVYAPDEAQRILYINNRQYKRGDEIPGGIYVEQIAPDGAVLQFRGQRFKLPRPS